MHQQDRNVTLVLIGLAVAAWIGVAILFVTRSPRGDVGVQLAGAALLGLAIALTAAPLFWLASFSRQRRIAYRGDWTRAARRGVLAGVLAAVFVVLRSQGIFSLPLGVFVVAMAVVVEATLSLRR